MPPVLTKPSRPPVRDMGRIAVPIAVMLLAGALFALLLDLVAAPATVDRLILDNRGATEVELGLESRDEPGVLWIASVEPESTIKVEEVLDQGEVWMVRGEHAGRPVGELRVSRAELERRGWRVVIPEAWGARGDQDA